MMFQKSVKHKFSQIPILILWLILFCPLGKLWAQPTVILPSGSLNLSPQETLCFPVVTNDFTDILSVKFTIRWNPAVIQFTGVSGFNIPNLDISDFDVSLVAGGILTMDWSKTNPGVTIPDGTKLFDICFRAVAAVPSKTDLVFSDSPEEMFITRTNSGGNDILAGQFDKYMVGGTILVENTGPLEARLMVNSIVGNPGDLVCLDVTAADFVNIRSVNFTMKWDQSLLEFVEINYDSFPGAIPSGSVLTTTTAVTLGEILCNYSSPFLPLNFNSHILYRVCFRIKGKFCDQIPVNIQSGTTGLQMRNTSNMAVVPKIIQGLVTVRSNPSERPTIRISNESVLAGQRACVDIVSSGITNMTRIKFTLAWDPSIVSFQSVQNFNLSGLSVLDFNTTQASFGNLILDWTSPSPAGVTRPNGSSLFSVCFNAIGSAGTNTPVTLVPLPEPVLSQRNGSLCQSNGIEIFKGNVKVVAANGNNFKVFSKDTTVTPGSNFCVEVYGLGGNDVSGITFPINWDPGVLSFQSIQLAGEGQAAGMTLVDFFTGNSSEGKVELGFIYTNGICLSLSDSALLFKICFTAIGPLGSSSNLRFSGSSNEIDIPDCGVSKLNLVNQGGKVNISSAVLNINNEIIDPVTCSKKGGISFAVSGGQGPFFFRWSPNVSTSNSASNLDPGNYSVTVTDSSIPIQERIKSYSVSDQRIPPTADAGIDVSFICGVSSVSIGGTNTSTGADFTYLWSSPTGTFSGLITDATALATSPGTYVLTVTNTKNGCVSTDEVIVSTPGIPIFIDRTIFIQGCEGVDETILNPLFPQDTLGNDFRWVVNTASSQISQTIEKLEIKLAKGANQRAMLIAENRISKCADTLFVNFEVFENPRINPLLLGTIACGDQKATLVSNATNAQIYSWTTTTGNLIGPINQASAEIGSNGRYLLEVASNKGCKASGMLDITQFSAQVNSVILPVSQIACGVPSVLLDGRNSTRGPSIDYRWTTLNGTLGSVVNRDTARAFGVGTYSLIVFDRNTGCSDTSMVTVSGSQDVPVVVLTPLGKLNCDSSQMTILSQVSPPGTYSYAWTTNNGGNILGPSNRSSIRINTGGNYLLTVTNISNGCSSSRSFSAILDTIKPRILSTVQDSLTCSVKLVNSKPFYNPSSRFVLEWGSVVGVDIVAFNPDGGIRVNTAGEYLYTLVDTVNKCDVSGLLTIKGDTSGVYIRNGGLSFNLDCSVTKALISANVFIFNSSPSNERVVWSSATGAFSNGPNPQTIIATRQGTYQIRVTNLLNSCFDTASYFVNQTLNGDPAIAGPDQKICGLAGTLEALPLNSPATGVWSSSNSNIQFNNPSSPNSGFILSSPGTFTFVWTASIPGCPNYSRDEVQIIVASSPNLMDDIGSVAAFDIDTVIVDILANDIINSEILDPEFFDIPSDFDIDFVNRKLRVGFPVDFSGTTTFSYKVCLKDCPDNCVSSSIKVTRPKKPDPPLPEPKGRPNTITPNGDNVNDALIFDELLGTSTFPNSELTVFGRWGDILYQSSKPYGNDWKGTNQSGQELPDGTYYYILRVDIAGAKVIQGDITILK
jgi:large repetitive protein